MADNDGARLVVTLQAKIDGYTAQLAKANATTLDRASRIEARFAQMEGKLNSSGASAGRAFDPIAAGAARAASALEQAASRSESAAQRMRRASVGPGPTASALLGSGAVGGGAAGAVAQDVAAAEARIRGASGEMRAALVEVAAAFGEVFAVGKAIEYADQWTRFSNAIHLAGKEGEAFASTQQALLDTANRNGVAIEGVSSLYRQLGLSQKQLGLSDADLIKFTQGFTAAVRVQGTDSKTASYAVLELAHGLDEGKIQARQFNALALEMPVILQAVARHIDGANGSVGKLRQLILGGSVDSRTFAQAFVAASGEVQAQADKAQLTIGASFTTLENHLIEYVGRAGATSGATAAFSQAIVGLADHLDVLAPALAVISTTLGVSYAAGLKAGEGRPDRLGQGRGHRGRRPGRARRKGARRHGRPERGGRGRAGGGAKRQVRRARRNPGPHGRHRGDRSRGRRPSSSRPPSTSATSHWRRTRSPQAIESGRRRRRTRRPASARCAWAPGTCRPPSRRRLPAPPDRRRSRSRSPALRRWPPCRASSPPPRAP